MEKMELKELKEKTKQWVEYYNSERLHQSLGYPTMVRNATKLQYEQKIGSFLSKYWGAFHSSDKTQTFISYILQVINMSISDTYAGTNSGRSNTGSSICSSTSFSTSGLNIFQ